RLAPGTSATALGRLGAGDRADRGRREGEPLELEGSGEALLNSNRDPFGQGTSQTLTKSAKSSVQAASSLLDGHGVPRIPEWTNRVLPASRTSRGPLPCREGRHDVDLHACRQAPWPSPSECPRDTRLKPKSNFVYARSRRRVTRRHSLH